MTLGHTLLSPFAQHTQSEDGAELEKSLKDASFPENIQVISKFFFEKIYFPFFSTVAQSTTMTIVRVMTQNVSRKRVLSAPPSR